MVGINHSSSHHQGDNSILRSHIRSSPSSSSQSSLSSTISSTGDQKLSWPLTSFDNTVQNVCCIAFLLGCCFTFNLNKAISNYHSKWFPLHIYFLTLTTFHLLEFLVTAIWNPTRVTVDSFLLNNGLSYYLAQLVCTIEFVYSHTSDRNKTQVFKHRRIVSLIGLGCLIVGQFIRTMAMITAAQSFNHQVSTHKKKQEDHELVTHGIYGIARHPSYLGFFWWSLGIQLYLGNWFSLVVFSSVLWRFFNHRIQIEEKHLIIFFGKSYIDYKSSTPTYIPFIK
ncbi:Isoprenylcysteine carboxyl methyltransferase family-domain-containing protein [Phakopsora pachyrhizi]|nr:Isoprenylcysteine carboxyl methyltransferase family-domain-containing protein [Phakopsora pachyrhizi]KAI8449806.1 Isoprenylcysteine carboxyl methyltransferase family-domain-containing protein [Phakopsora pachyrhizi]